MQHFITLVKKKGLHLELGQAQNQMQAARINRELMQLGYVLNKELFELMTTQSDEELEKIHTQIVEGVREFLGDGDYEPIYKDFPSYPELEIEREERILQAVFNFWDQNDFLGEDKKVIEQATGKKAKDFKTLGLISRETVLNCFYDILYSGKSISAFDKNVVDYFIDLGTNFDFTKITFKETQAYVGKRLLENPNISILPTKNATTILRIWAAYSGGDETLKTPTRFKNPNGHQRRILLNSLNASYNLEEAFKTDREVWLKVLFQLHPMSKKIAKKYGNVAQYADALRNRPKTLKTYNSRVEELLDKKDVAVFELLRKRMGVFSRRLDHTVRIFGEQAIEQWLMGNPNLDQLFQVYNHFSDRDQQTTRSAVLSYQSKSEMVQYGSLAALDATLVQSIQERILDKIKAANKSILKTKKVYIDRTLYYRNLNVNNRASSFSLDGNLNGTVERITGDKKIVRMYVHWHGKHDIDLSGFGIRHDGSVDKIGWNGLRNSAGIVYSGDNTGNYAKNAEYLDVDTTKLGAYSWIVVDATIFRGPRSYQHWARTEQEPVRAGFTLRSSSDVSSRWTPESVERSIILQADSKNAFLMAFHVETKSLVYLDLSMGTKNVSSAEDAIKMQMYLDKFVSVDDGTDKIEWKRLNQGHVLNLMAGEIVKDAESADVVFDENTTFEEVQKYF